MRANTARILTVALAGVTVALASAQSQGSGGYGIGSKYNGLYRRQGEVRLTGTITGKIKGTPMPGMTERASILLRTRRNGVVAVDLGPTWFIKEQKATLNMGDAVTVVGPWARLDKSRFIMARLVRKGKTLMALRDVAGSPYWSAYRRGRVAVRNNNGINGTVASTGNWNVNGTQYGGYVLNTPNGPVNVAVAPDWYWQRQDGGFSIGDNVTAFPYGGVMQITPGYGVYMANGLVGPGGYYDLYGGYGNGDVTVMSGVGAPVVTGSSFPVWNPMLTPNHP